MKIECFFSEGCGSKKQLMHNIGQALRKEGMEAHVSSREISEEEANHLGIGGSPTVCVDDDDIEPGAPPGGIS